MHETEGQVLQISLSKATSIQIEVVQEEFGATKRGQVSIPSRYAIVRQVESPQFRKIHECVAERRCGFWGSMELNVVLGEIEASEIDAACDGRKVVDNAVILKICP